MAQKDYDKYKKPAAALVLSLVAAIFNLSLSLSASAQSGSKQSPAVYFMDGKPVDEKTYQGMTLSNQAGVFINKNEFDKAIPILSRAVELAPEAGLVQSNYGMALARVGRMDEAMEHLEKALVLDPKLPSTYITLGGVYQSTGRIPDAIKIYKDYLQHFPKHEFAGKITGLLQMLTSEVATQRNAGGEGASANDYINQFAAMATRWSDKHMPLKVFISPASQVPGYKPEYGSAVKDAFDFWAKASAGKISLVYVDSAAKADIEFAFSNDIKRVSSPAEGGEAKVIRDAEGIRHATIVVLTIDPSPGRPLTPLLMRWICAHEVGHAFGIVGHSSNPNDVMYASMPMAEQDRGLSARDVNTIVRLYDKGFEPPKETIVVTGGNANSPQALNNEAAMAIKNGKAELAVQKLEQALKMDPNLQIAKDNLGSAYCTQAMQLAGKGKYSEADQLFKKAVALQGTAPKNFQNQNVIKAYAMFLRLSNRMPEALKLEASLK